jgi:hypothetical protein
LPLALELKNAEVITVPAKGENTYDTTFYGVCLATQNVQIAKKGGNFVATPLKNAIDENSYAAMMGEAKTNNGKVNTVSLREGMFDAFRNSINATCGHTNIEVIEDTNGTLHAVSGFAR